MRLDESTPNRSVQALRSFMEQFYAEQLWQHREQRSEKARKRAGWKYPCYQDLLLDLGQIKVQDYFVPDDEVFSLAQAKQQCFLNAYHVVLEHPERYTYVEGRACAGSLIVPHAWVEDEEGRVVDPTWANHLDPTLMPTYYGIRFDADFVFKRVSETGWVSLLNREWSYEPNFPSLRFGFEFNDAGLVIDYKESV